MKTSHTRSSNLVSAIVLVALAQGCSGDGCGGMTPIPGGFPPDDRVENAVQVRVSESGLSFFEDELGGIVGGLLGGGDDLAFDIPPACSGNPLICCDDGTPLASCGPVAIDLAEQAGDLPRAELEPIEGESTLSLVVRPRVATVVAIPIVYDTGFITADCDVEIDTAPGDFADLKLTAALRLLEDPDMGTTRLVVEDVVIDQLESDDINLVGGLTCSFGNLIIGTFLGTLSDTFADAIESTLSQQVCKSCASGDVAECGAFADACTDGVCMKGDACIQELGITGRLSAQALLSSLSPGTQGAIDVYAVAGGDASTDAGGLALGMLGGMLPAGAERDRCGPPSTRPADVSIAPSTYFQGNTRPDTGETFDIGLGIHEHELDLLAWSAYESGFLCLDIGTRSVPLLSSDTLALVIPSLAGLLHGETGQVVLGLRPQSPPSIVLGAGTYVEDSSGEMVIDEPLLDLRFEALEVDLFAMVDDQFIRILTLRSDVHLPINLDVTPSGEVAPVLGDLDEAFTNIVVENSEALTEDPADLAERFPPLLSLALSQAIKGVGSFALPEVGGVALELAPNGIAGVDDDTYLALFASLGLSPSPAPRVETEARLVRVTQPESIAFAAPARHRSERPAVELELGGHAEGGADLEWSFRTGGGAWSPYTRSRRVRLSRESFWLRGEHEIEVRARVVGQPLTTDRTPVVLAPVIAASDAPDRLEAPAPETAGCSAVGASSNGAAALLVFAAMIGLGGSRRRRRLARALSSRSLVLVMVGAAATLAPACSCGSDPAVECADDMCAEGEVERGPTGRWSSLAADGDRVVAAAYEQRHGDLVLVDVAADGAHDYQVVDGIAEGAAPIYDPSGYRGGVDEAGPDVGAWTSVALVDGRARIAYQDRDGGQLRYAAETGDGWQVHVVDAEAGAELGPYASLAIGPDGAPAIAYMAVGVDDASGRVQSQLRLARASSASPASDADWSVEVLDEVPVSCAGLCGDGAACLAEEAGERCVATTDDCSAECGDDQVCVAGACTEPVAEPVGHDLPPGTGLFANLEHLPSGEPVVVYYDRVAGDLVMQVYDGGWSRVVLDAESATDTGRFASALVDDAGTVHVAYGDALDRLLYTSYASGTAGPIEIVDDGTREGDRPHPVGASAALFVDAAGALAIAYQDGATSDLWLARRGADDWQRAALHSGPELYGFYTRATTAGGTSWISTYMYDRTIQATGELVFYSE